MLKRMNEDEIHLLVHDSGKAPVLTPKWALKVGDWVIVLQRLALLEVSECPFCGAELNSKEDKQ